MRISFASDQGQGRANEDRVCAGDAWALVIDGATAVPGLDTGCRHGVSWLVDRLSGTLAGELSAEEPAPLTDCLAAAVESTRRAHGAGCDPDHPDSPSATVAVVRPEPAGPDAPPGPRRLEYLVLADCTVVLAEADGEVAAITDDRVEHLPGGRPYSAELVRTHRNAEGGFWVAGALPEAAYRAVTGVSRTAGAHFALMTDGCARLAGLFGHPWPRIWRSLESGGPDSLLAWVRAEEERRGASVAKRHDDATVVAGAFAPRARPTG
ncbi:hypothetical protein LP52_20270 [Streptomonospora alba]|uniref:PPM-type phosphatase domain-containing protein n=1 Tax=Streptomonospora alba TaxID=183763 RepID=A0A0C2JEF6_9ACTN|nr:protein phosphatase 2C domain-containing protein [Streptomonospora alba]KIH97300.1 hypothetical protein LP52_20270 [Streptomonospora alba]